MAHAGRIEDMTPEHRYSVNRISAIIDQTEWQFPLVKQEIKDGFLYHAEKLQALREIIYIYADPELKKKALEVFG